MIPFNKPCVTGNEITAIEDALSQNKISGNGLYDRKCMNWLEENLDCAKALLTPSCTAALEMTALLLNIKEGDEVIMPSYTFVSTANAYALQGAHIRFVDIEQDTMNISALAIENAITNKTKAIVVVHYAGIACDMDAVMEIAKDHGLYVIEDAAQALMTTYKGRQLGTIGHFGTFSFHDTKNITCGEGGALIINDRSFIERAEIIQEKGTNRNQFVRGEVDKYTWRDIGSSYLISDLTAAYLFVQLQHVEQITNNRLEIWNSYARKLRDLEISGHISLPRISSECKHNAHMFYIKTNNREALMDYLKEKGITAKTHYVPLHEAYAGEKYGSFAGTDKHTTKESGKLVRLPLYYGLKEQDVAYVVNHLYEFFKV
ncbi:dTDP-4-amino-4,6-dideoxygalactose transaminase [Virgibacillus sp. W0181]|uniref:dTDP-4-amino-4,6-dideoxygalactose transaminase n=1 Tax=Virgibacillus sp. W0181 TaxID=3391581 RepID=UPI003F48FEE5